MKNYFFMKKVEKEKQSTEIGLKNIERLVCLSDSWRKFRATLIGRLFFTRSGRRIPYSCLMLTSGVAGMLVLAFPSTESKEKHHIHSWLLS